jgi:formate hydrogenlyase subunit 3/multisubunit Na+/H+ antiporter MnhD subunit
MVVVEERKVNIILILGCISFSIVIWIFVRNMKWMDCNICPPPVLRLDHLEIALLLIFGVICMFGFFYFIHRLNTIEKKLEMK